MTTIVITPDVVAAMPWHARQRLITATLRAERVRREVAPSEATVALALLPPDPDAAAHRAGIA